MQKSSLFHSFIALIIATLALVSAFATVNFFIGSALTVVIAMAWGVFIWRRWEFGGILCMLILVLGNSLAVILGGSRLIALTSLLATLSTWDLAAFHNHLSSSSHIINQDQLIRSHLFRLISVVIIGLTLPLLTFRLQLDLEFWQVFLLGILLIAGLSQVFAQFKRSSERS